MSISSVVLLDIGDGDFLDIGDGDFLDIGPVGVVPLLFVLIVIDTLDISSNTSDEISLVSELT